MARSMTTRRLLVILAAALLLGATVMVGLVIREGAEGRGLPRAAQKLLVGAEEREGESEREFREGTQGRAGDESAEALTAAQQWAEARTAPGIVAPGAYSIALAEMNALPVVGLPWDEITDVPYDADDPVYRDYFSNSGGGSGLVTGRITAVAADDAGNVYVGAANGGVWRSTTGGGDWTPIADALPSLSSGDLQLAADGSLWYATGEANTGGTSYVGSGVYRIEDPTTGTFLPSDRVGGIELESTTINALRFDGHGRVYAATLRGVWMHADDTNSGAWTLLFAPNPSFLPGGGDATHPNAAYKNIVNDLVIDPANDEHIVAGAAWRSGDAYNGFYESWDRGATWAKVNLLGGIDKNDIGNITFAFAADGSKLYLMNQSPKLLNSLAANQMTLLDGIYVSNTGSPSGPWNKIASPSKLAASGSALAKQFGIGYRPGVQSWYNQFLIVDPNDPLHVYAGLEEVFETKNGGTNWNVVGPYWNFYFKCWDVDAVYPPNGEPNRCPQTTHPDQHAVAIGSDGEDTYVYVGNDGGIYRRPLDGAVDRSGHATDWESLNDGTIDALQYYAVDVGRADPTNPDYQPGGTGDIVSGGLQDNGGSIYRIGATSGKMSSNFGGDGGDVLVDPNNGCNILQEYVVLTLQVTQTCANPIGHDNAFLDPSDATTFDVSPPDINARFIAPFVADDLNIDNWLAGGNSIWFQDNGFAIRDGDEWEKVYTFSSPTKVATAMAYRGEWAIAAWCGTCNNLNFARGIAVGHYTGGEWTWTEPLSSAALTTGGVPNRYVGGAAVDPAGNLYVVMNGFSRRFTEGPGAGIGHVFMSTDHGASWVSLDATAGADFPDVPANSIKVMPDGSIVVGTDLGVLQRRSDGGTWQRLGTGLPVTVAIDVELGPNAMLYVATHGRGIWRIGPFDF